MRLASFFFVVTAVVPSTAQPSEVIQFKKGTVQTSIVCTDDAKVCPDGTALSRDSLCRFPECPKQPKFCSQDDVMECADGRLLSRDPKLGCKFPPCELKCCDPLDMPNFIEGGHCCGVTGQWVPSRGDGKTFTCGGITLRGPHYPPPFGKPCPVNCGDIQDKDKCQRQSGEGCVWFYPKKACVHQGEIPCDAVPKRNICKRLRQTCKWRKGSCQPKCGTPNSKFKCNKKLDPVMCGTCEYPNLCMARSHGQRKKKCKKICKSHDNCGAKESCEKESTECKSGYCPSVCVPKTIKPCDVSTGATCPVGEKCVPSPRCPAGEKCPGHCTTDGCTKPPSPNKCKDEFNPVECGDSKCQYKNMCLAESAGYRKDQCQGYCPEPNPFLKCPETYPPLRCGNAECEYNGACHAQSVGFSQEQCQPDCRLMPCPAVYCPNAVIPPNGCCPVCKTLCPYYCAPIRCPAGHIAGKKNPDDCCDTCIKIEDKKPDCSLVDCAMPMCPVGQKAVVPPNECCAQCQDDGTTKCDDYACPLRACPAGMKHEKKPNECCPTCVRDKEYKHDCSMIACAMEICPDGQSSFTKPGDCCPSCVKDPTREIEDPFKLDCSNVLCAAPQCGSGHRAVTEPGQCCPKCVRDPCTKPDCSLVRCFYHPNCADDEEPYYPDNSCCASKCIKKSQCKMRCIHRDCKDDEELVKEPGQCCPVCKKKCMRKWPTTFSQHQ